MNLVSGIRKENKLQEEYEGWQWKMGKKIKD